MTDITDEILEILGERKAEIKGESIVVEDPETLVEATITAALVATDWEAMDEDAKYHRRLVPFSQKFWEPRYVPDHLVAEFSGYDTIEVPDVYIPPVREFEMLSLGFSVGAKVNIVGPTGAGKTQMDEYYAACTGRPFLRIEHNVELDKASVFGQTHITTDEHGTQVTDFVPGDLPLSMAAPTLVVLDEVTRATGHANMIYQRVLDRRELYMPEMRDAGTKSVTPHEDWIITATDNTKGNGEDMDKYPMSNVQDAAFINRWDILIEVDYLTAAQEAELLKAWSPKMRTADRTALARFSNLIHSGFKSGEITTAFSPRNLITICKLVNAGLPLSAAIEMNYTSRLPSTEKADVNECFRAAFGSEDK